MSSTVFFRKRVAKSQDREQWVAIYSSAAVVHVQVQYLMYYFTIGR